MTDERCFDWHGRKAASNLADHKVPFEAVFGFEFETALIVEDMRKDYGEVRMIAFGLIGIRLHVLVYTERPEVTWVISLRKANDREVERYGKFARSQAS